MTNWGGPQGPYDPNAAVGPSHVDPEAPTQAAGTRPAAAPTPPVPPPMSRRPSAPPSAGWPQQAPAPAAPPTPWQQGPAAPPPQAWPPAGAGMGAPPAHPYGPGSGGPFGPPPRRRRTGLILAGCAVIAVIAIVVVIAISVSGGSSHGRSGADAVKGYLDALSRGDAEAALSYGSDQPGSKTFLSDDILKKQIARWPISNVKILSDSSTNGLGGVAQVHVAANFGDKVSDVTLNVKKAGDDWKLDIAAIKVSPSPSGVDDASAKTVTLFGKPVGFDTFYVFPGFLDIASTNPYLTVTDKDALLLDRLNPYGSSWLHTEVGLNDQGNQAITNALGQQMANCSKSNLLSPPNCPLYLDPDGLAEGTVAWGTADISDVKVLNFDQYRMQVLFAGDVAFPSVTVKTTDGRNQIGRVHSYLSGTADMSKQPPALKYK